MKYFAFDIRLTNSNSLIIKICSKDSYTMTMWSSEKKMRKQWEGKNKQRPASIQLRHIDAFHVWSNNTHTHTQCDTKSKKCKANQMKSLQPGHPIYNMNRMKFNGSEHWIDRIS